MGLIAHFWISLQGSHHGSFSNCIQGTRFNSIERPKPWTSKDNSAPAISWINTFDGLGKFGCNSEYCCCVHAPFSVSVTMKCS